MLKKAIIGKKVGMTQIFGEKGEVYPVTVIEAGPCVVVQKKTEDHDGYSAVQVGFSPVNEKKLTKPEAGHFKKNQTGFFRYVKELRLEDAGNYQVGQEIKADIFAPGEVVDITGTSRGKGFAGGIKRHNFKRGPMAHGSKYHRRVGSLQSRDASRVFKGRRMPGRLGGDRVTVLNLSVVRVDPEKNLLLIKGAVPGATGSLVSIRNATKS